MAVELLTLPQNRPNFVGRLITALERAGIVFPEKPLERDYPGDWLVRGEGNKSKLVGQESHFTPHSGKHETFGVFLGDNATPVMPGSVLYVLKSQAVATEWLRTDSPEMDILVRETAARNKPPFRLDTYGGYVEAATQVYRQRAIYHPREGIASTPHPVPVSSVELVLVENSLLEEVRDRLVPNLKDRILPL